MKNTSDLSDVLSGFMERNGISSAKLSKLIDDLFETKNDIPKQTIINWKNGIVKLRVIELLIKNC